MRKIILGVVMAILALMAAADVTLTEAKKLDAIMGSSTNEIAEKLKIYEAKKSREEKNPDWNLAMAVIYAAQATSTPIVEGASYKAKEYIEKAMEKYRDSAYVVSKGGMIHSLVARDDGNPIIKVLEVGKAGELLDKAVKMAKGSADEWNIRYSRGNCYINFPDIFGKRPTAESDFRFVYEYSEKNTGKVPEEVLIGTYYQIGEIEKETGKIDNAIKFWKKSIETAKKINTATEESKKAKQQLELFEEE